MIVTETDGGAYSKRRQSSRGGPCLSIRLREKTTKGSKGRVRGDDCDSETHKS